MVRTVLIVDGNPHVRRALCELFTRDGDFEICGEAENGREAIEAAQQLPPDLIVTDLSMPIMNGLEETRLLKKLLPEIPVIIYTAQSDPFVGFGSALPLRCPPPVSFRPCRPRRRSVSPDEALTSH